MNNLQNREHPPNRSQKKSPYEKEKIWHSPAARAFYVNVRD